MIRLEMEHYNMILIEKPLKYKLYHQAIMIIMKILQEILPSNQQQTIEQAEFTYSPLGKDFEKQIKTIEDEEEKQIKVIQDQEQVKTIKNYVYNNQYTTLI